jgi:hypothetical protein
MEKLRKFLRLPPADRRLFLRAWLLLLAVRLGLWLAPFRYQYQFWRRLIAMAPGVPSAADTADHIAWAVPLAARYVPRATCLTQALAMQIMLCHEGAPGELRLGVARDEAGRLTAHAWVEHAGQVLIGGGQLGKYNIFSNPGGCNDNCLRL